MFLNLNLDCEIVSYKYVLVHEIVLSDISIEDRCPLLQGHVRVQIILIL